MSPHRVEGAACGVECGHRRARIKNPSGSRVIVYLWRRLHFNSPLTLSEPSRNARRACRLSATGRRRRRLLRLVDGTNPSSSPSIPIKVLFFINCPEGGWMIAAAVPESSLQRKCFSTSRPLHSVRQPLQPGKGAAGISPPCHRRVVPWHVSG